MACSPMEGECGWDPEWSWWIAYPPSRKWEGEAPHRQEVKCSPWGGSLFSVKREAELCAERECETVSALREPGVLWGY